MWGGITPSDFLFSSFPQVAFFATNSKRTASVRAKTWCDFACLEKEDFMSVASRFPEQRLALESLAHARIARDLLRKNLGAHPLFKDCSPELLKAISARFEPYEFYGGETLYVEGEPTDALLFVGMGQLQLIEKVEGASKKHDRVLTKFLNAGEFADVVPFMLEKKRYDVCKVWWGRRVGNRLEI